VTGKHASVPLSWSVKTLEIFSLYIFQINKGSRELTNHRFFIALNKMSKLFFEMGL